MSESLKQEHEISTPEIPKQSELFGLMLMVLAIVVINGVTLGFIGSTARGTFGDMFGLSNALFSGLAFAGVAYAIRLQHTQIAQASQQTALAKKDAADQRRSSNEQSLALKRQQFETTFFELLKLHHQIVSEIDIRRTEGSTIICRSRDSFKYLFKELQTGDWWGMDEEDKEQRLQTIGETYKKFYDKWQPDIGHYFRNLYHIVKLVDKQAKLGISQEERQEYVDLACASLSSHELALLFYNCLSELGVSRFRPLIEQYQMFDNLPIELLFNKRLHTTHYDLKAYGKQKEKVLNEQRS